MSRLIGRRGSGGSGWTWVVIGPGPPRPPRRPPFVRYVLALGGLTLALGLPFLLIWALRSDDGDEAVAQPPGETAAAATPTASPAIDRTLFGLAQWADLRQEWQYADLDATNSAYREGEAVPFMLRIDNAQPGTIYTVSIRYDCAHDGINAFDYLTGYDRDRGADPAQAPDGPGRLIPDHTASVPDDPSMLFDNAGAAPSFQAWGATFAMPPSRPLPLTLCRTGEGPELEKEITVQLQAQESTVWLLWGGHLASSLDWGQGHGAASIPQIPLRMELAVQGQALAGLDRAIRLVLPATAPTAATTPAP